MTEQDEKLSYLLDDYPGKNPVADVDEVIGDVNLQYRMRRYQMIGEAMRNELPQAIDTGFHSAIRARVRAEISATATDTSSAISAGEPAAGPSMFDWFSKPLAGLAVAATVAVVTVALWTPDAQQGNDDNEIASTETQKVEALAGQQGQGTAVTVSTNVRPQGMRWKVDHDAPALQQKLNAYLVNHTEYSNSVQGLIPQARVAGFDAQQ